MSRRPSDQKSRAPYPGLRPFERHESILFFGRDDCVNAMVETLQRSHFLAVLGASGSGKSSLVRTGLFEALEAGHAVRAGSRWVIADIRHPGGTPFRELARALFASLGEEPSEEAVEALRDKLGEGPGALVEWWKAADRDEEENLLVLADQFEELFRYRTSSQRDNVEFFVDLLLASAASGAPIYVVLTMRSEYLGVCSLISGLAEQINQSLGLTPRMLRDECKAAIEGPSRIVGFTIEQRLVQALLNDMNTLAAFCDEEGDARREVDQAELIARRADQLPLMQHVLNLLWMDAVARHKGKAPVELTWQDYRDVGGLQGALTLHADRVKDSTREPELTEKIFRALTEGTTVAGAVRRNRTLAELIAETGAEEARVRAVIDAFRAPGANFLAPALPEKIGLDDKVDISHESLIRQWTSLSGWLTQEAEDGRTWRALQRAALRREEEGLLGGAALRSNQDWLAETDPTPAWIARYDGGESEVRGFLADSEAEDSRAQLRRKGLRMAAIAGIALAPLIWVGGTTWYAQAQETVRAEARKDTVKAVEEAGRARGEAARTRADSARMQADTARVQAKAATDVKSARREIQRAQQEARQLVGTAQRQLAASEAEASRIRSGALQFADITARSLRSAGEREVPTFYRPGTPRTATMASLEALSTGLKEARDVAPMAGIDADSSFAVPGARLALARAEFYQAELRPDLALTDAEESFRLAQHARGGADDEQGRALQAEALVLQARALLLLPGRGEEGRAKLREAVAMVPAESPQRPSEDAARAAILANHWYARSETSANAIERAVDSVDRCLRVVRRFPAPAVAQSNATDPPPAVDPASGPEAPTPSSPPASFDLAFGGRMLCLTPIVLLAPSQPVLDGLFARWPDDVGLLNRSDAQGVLMTDSRILRAYTDAMLDSRAFRDIGIDLAEEFTNPLPRIAISTNRNNSESNVGRPREGPSPSPYDSWYLVDMLSYSRLRSRSPFLALTDVDRIRRIDEAVELYRGIRGRLERARYPQEHDAARRDFLAQLRSPLENLQGRPASAAIISVLAAESNALVSAGSYIGTDPTALDEAETLSRDVARMVSNDGARLELQRYPHFLTTSSGMLSRIGALCDALTRSSRPPCANRAQVAQLVTLVDDNMAEFARVNGRQAQQRMIGQPTTSGGVAFEGVDVVACVSSLENGENLASADTPVDPFDYRRAMPASGSDLQAADSFDMDSSMASMTIVSPASASAPADPPPICRLRRGLGLYAAEHHGQVWLFTSETNKLEFEDNPQKYVQLTAAFANELAERSTFSRASSGAGWEFGRIIDHKLRFFPAFEMARTYGPGMTLEPSPPLIPAPEAAR